jgi:FKBP-type peptidyl-prolyl cis-trans isomerase 2
MDRPNKQKRKQRLSKAQSEDSRYKSQIVPLIDGLGLINSVDKSRQPVEISAQRSLLQSLDMAVEGHAVPEDDTLTLNVTDAPGQIS